MSIRFSTKAANADVMGEDTPAAGAPPKPEEVGPDVVPGGDRPQQAKPKRGKAGAGDVKLGQDIDAPGSVKDQDTGKPS